MNKVFYRKQFSDYLGENRAILDIVADFEPGISPTPSVTAQPTATPTNTGTPTPTPTITASATPPATPTQTPTPTQVKQDTTAYIFSPRGFNITGATTTEILVNGTTAYPIDQILSADTLYACNILLDPPYNGIVYTFEIQNIPSQFVIESGVGCGFNPDILYDEITYTVTSGPGGIGGNQYNADIRYFYQGVQVGTTATNGAVYYPNAVPDICGVQTIDLSCPPGFYLSETEAIMTENSDIITNEAGVEIFYDAP